MTDPEKVAASLTKAQRKFILGGNVNWPTIMGCKRRGLVIQRICYPDGNGLPLTPLGLAVRAHLLKGNPDNGE